MYIGLGPESGKRVMDADAFCYACERAAHGTGHGDKEAGERFLSISRTARSMDEFVEDFNEWFYSGNWLYEEE